MLRRTLLAAVVLALAGCLAESEETQASSINWVTNYSEGLRLSRETGKPVMLYFTADWCGPCVELKKHVFPDSRIVEAAKRLINVYVDVDRNPEILSIYKVRGIPAIFFLNPQGEMIAKFTGDRSVGSLVKQMTAIADNHTR
jgi:thiol:disulfide interchange protein